MTPITSIHPICGTSTLKIYESISKDPPDNLCDYILHHISTHTDITPSDYTVLKTKYGYKGTRTPINVKSKVLLKYSNSDDISNNDVNQHK